MGNDFQDVGSNQAALFTLKLHRGESMVLLGMNWRTGTPTPDFVGFGIEFKAPDMADFKPVTNRLAFPGQGGAVVARTQSSLQSPIQKFRWVHFPRNAGQLGMFRYRVTPVFMDSAGKLGYGEPQEAAIQLGTDTHAAELNVAFTRGFVSSQAFVDTYQADGHTLKELLPAKADAGLDFKPTHPKAAAAFDWMGFEAREILLAVLDKALAQPDAQVKVVAYDLNLPEVVDRLAQLGSRLRIIIDDSDAHGAKTSAETAAAARLAQAGAQVLRQHMLSLQHNKTIVVHSAAYNAVVCGSTNFSWRAFYVQSNNALVLETRQAADIFGAAFDIYWAPGTGAGFQRSPATLWTDLKLPTVQAKVTFSPHGSAGAVLQSVADDVATTTSSLLFSLAFLYQTPGKMRDTIQQLEKTTSVFVYGMSDREVGGLDLKNADGRFVLTQPGYLDKDVPQPFRSEPSGMAGIRLHHKFLVVDFDKPTARVYLGSFNFSIPADVKNGENLLVIRDRKVATAYMVEALRLFDHYEFRSAKVQAKGKGKPLQLATPPAAGSTQAPWWDRYWSEPLRARDRQLFS